jgi:hypothetical protein
VINRSSEVRASGRRKNAVKINSTGVAMTKRPDTQLDNMSTVAMNASAVWYLL